MQPTIAHPVADANGWLVLYDYNNSPYYVTVPDGICSSCILIPCISLGVLGNLAVLFLMPATDRVSKRSKMFYMAIAIADCSVLVIIHGLSLFPRDGLAWLTHGTTYWSLLWMNRIALVTTYDLWDITKSCSACLLAGLSFERAFAVLKPFKARLITTKRSALMLLGICLYALLYRSAPQLLRLYADVRTA
jgi:hypothetical protein